MEKFIMANNDFYVWSTNSDVHHGDVASSLGKLFPNMEDLQWTGTVKEREGNWTWFGNSINSEFVSETTFSLIKQTWPHVNLIFDGDPSYRSGDASLDYDFFLKSLDRINTNTPEKTSAELETRQKFKGSGLTLWYEFGNVPEVDKIL